LVPSSGRHGAKKRRRGEKRGRTASCKGDNQAQTKKNEKGPDPVGERNEDTCYDKHKTRGGGERKAWIHWEEKVPRERGEGVNAKALRLFVPIWRQSPWLGGHPEKGYGAALYASFGMIQRELEVGGTEERLGEGEIWERGELWWDSCYGSKATSWLGDPANRKKKKKEKMIGKDREEKTRKAAWGRTGVGGAYWRTKETERKEGQIEKSEGGKCKAETEKQIDVQ